MAAGGAIADDHMVGDGRFSGKINYCNILSFVVVKDASNQLEKLIGFSPVIFRVQETLRRGFFVFRLMTLGEASHAGKPRLGHLIAQGTAPAIQADDK